MDCHYIGLYLHTRCCKPRQLVQRSHVLHIQSCKLEAEQTRTLCSCSHDHMETTRVLHMLSFSPYSHPHNYQTHRIESIYYDFAGSNSLSHSFHLHLERKNCIPVSNMDNLERPGKSQRILCQYQSRLSIY